MFNWSFLLNLQCTCISAGEINGQRESPLEAELLGTAWFLLGNLMPRAGCTRRWKVWLWIREYPILEVLCSRFAASSWGWCVCVLAEKASAGMQSFTDHRGGITVLLSNKCRQENHWPRRSSVNRMFSAVNNIPKSFALSAPAKC